MITILQFLVACVAALVEKVFLMDERSDARNAHRRRP
jgi:hypothetical protein